MGTRLMPSATAVYSPIGLPGGGETDSPRVPQPRPARLLAARLLAPMLSLAIALMLALPADAARLRVGVYGQDPPLSFIDSNGQLAGFDIDFARALCRQAGFDCELIQTDWQELLPALVRRRLDAVVASLSITDERRELVAFTRPYYDSPGRFIIARSGRFDELDPETLTGVQIGVPRQTTFDRYATDTLSEWAEIHRYTTRQDALADLVLGRTDLVIGDHIALRENFLATEVGEGFELVGEPLADSRWFGDGIGVAVAKGDTALLERLDQAIGELHRNGVFDLIRRRCFDYGIRNLTATLRAEEAARHAESAP
jgi:ABC-type amino acid transport substrate-binding protein